MQSSAKWSQTALQIARSALGFHLVDEGYVLLVKRLGGSRRILTPGLRFVVPVFEKIEREVCLIGHHLEFPMDSRQLEADLYFQILDPTRTVAVIDDVDQTMTDMAKNTLAKLTGEFPVLSDKLKTELNRQANPMGIRVIRCAVSRTTAAV